MFGFFGEVAAKAAKKPTRAPSRDLPSELLGKMGCDACPRAAAGARLDSPKMASTGASSPEVFVLSASPTGADDRAGRYAEDAVGQELRKLLRGVKARYGALVQCWDHRDPAVCPATLGCCKPRVLEDIEVHRPQVVVTVGDSPLTWATGLHSAMTWRGTLMPARFGAHVCWVYVLIYPNYLESKRRTRSEHELVMRHDIQLLTDLVEAGLPPAQVEDSGKVFDNIHLIIPNHFGPGHTFNELEHRLQGLLQEPLLGLDIETNGLRPWKTRDPKILTAAVGTYENTVAFPLDFPDTWVTDRWRKKAWDLFGDFLMSSNRKVVHHLGLEMAWLSYFYGKRVLRGTEWEDSLLAAHTFDARPGTKSLEAQTVINFGFNLKAQSALDVKRLTTYPLARVLRYNGGDAKYTHKIFTMQREGLIGKLRDEYERKIKLAPTLVATEHRGLRVDREYAEELEKTWAERGAKIRREISRLPEVKEYERQYRKTFDPGNSDQVLTMMQCVCHREEVVVEERGSTRLTTDEEALSSIPASEVPSAPLILELRGADKLRSTYIAPILGGSMLCTDGRIRAQYGSAVAVTGRLNAEDPNIQNFPKRKHKEIRGTVIPHEGRALMPCDYGQLEFRVAGMCSEDDNLVRYCWTGYDVHKDWAERMLRRYGRIKDWIVSEFKVDWDEKGLKTLRQEVKNKWVFPSFFGAAVPSRARNLHLPEDVATDLDADFWGEFPGVKKWQKRLVAHYEKYLYVEMLGGRKRRGPMSLNEIINSPIQGSGADIVTAAMSALSEQADELEWDGIDPVINVHDDLTFEPMLDDIDRVQSHVGAEMTRPRFPWIIVPLVVEVSLGPRWHECKEVAVIRGEEVHNLRNPYA